MEEIIDNYLNRLNEFRILALAPLEVNFLINLGWVILRTIFKASSDYRISKLRTNGSATTNIFIFLQFKAVLFIFSFLVTFMVSFSLNFWLDYLEMETASFAWWLPSGVAIGLAEISSLVSGILKEKEEMGKTIVETEIEKKGQELFIYIFVSFFLLVVFWVFMLLTRL